VLEEILRGKRRQYDDAFAIDAMTTHGEISIIKASAVTVPSLGKGERSILAAMQDNRIDAIVSDDQRFLATLQQTHTPFITSADIIVLLHTRRALTHQEASDALGRLRPFITPTHHNHARQTIDTSKETTGENNVN
jgi:hypothetical protein